MWIFFSLVVFWCSNVISSYPLETVFSPLFPTLFDDGLHSNTPEVTSSYPATSSQLPVHFSTSHLLTPTRLSVVLGHTTTNDAHKTTSTPFPVPTPTITNVQSMSISPFSIHPSSSFYSFPPSVTATASSSPNKALSFVGDSKEWKIVGIAVISIASVVAVILLTVFFDSWWAFLRDVICRRKRNSDEYKEDLVPDWSRQSWQVKLATEEGHRYPTTAAQVYAGALHDDKSRGVIPSLPPRLASPEASTPYFPQPLYRHPSTKSQYAERYPQVPSNYEYNATERPSLQHWHR
ncbi:atp-binding cassette transporter [Moniliophthora roreri MCA 2997]|uniref:Atp-binding cassette transporter n=2 Tax=Moniliophthora roreri TaxID=221103 RepID=V2WYR2_MONRO|nr:atp-binding cassette transporter [Moniliophthora roreri MCA 2997]